MTYLWAIFTMPMGTEGAQSTFERVYRALRSRMGCEEMVVKEHPSYSWDEYKPGKPVIMALYRLPFTGSWKDTLTEYRECGGEIHGYFLDESHS